MSTSKLQRATSQFLSVHFGSYTIRENIRPDWLITEKGERLELDFLIEELNIAIEVQGEQHYVFTPFFQKDSDGFKDRLRCDNFKKRVCEQMGLRLIEIAGEADLYQLHDLARPISKIFSPPEPLDGATRGLLYNKAIQAKHNGSLNREERIRCYLLVYGSKAYELKKQIQVLENIKAKESKIRKLKRNLRRLNEHIDNLVTSISGGK